MTSYLKHLPKPLLDDIVAGRCVPIVGSGFSRNAAIPTGLNMPLWDDLGRKLSEAFTGYEYSGPLEAISAYSDEFSRVKLVERLLELLLVDRAEPGDTHRSFCKLPFNLVVTTNIEFLLEKGYQQVNRYCRPLIDEEHLSIDSSGPEVKLLKFHGDLHHPKQLVMTEEDYDGFIERHPLLATFLANLLITRTALFIGYSLDDPDFRQVWQIIGDRLGKLRRQPYTILLSPSPHVVRRFERRGVKVISLPGKHEDYPRILADLFNELRGLWSNMLIKQSTATDEEPLAEFYLPSDSVGRLCFFSVPSRLSAFYRVNVFPIAERHGFVPVMAYDVIAPGDSITAKIDALIDRSALMLVDLSSPTTQLEYHTALAHRGDTHWVLIVAEKDARVPFDIRGIGHVIRPKPQELDKSDFIINIDKWFARVAAALKPELNEEPMRLLKKKEYRAAVISAITLLESELRSRLETLEPCKGPLRLTLGRLMELAVDRQLLPAEYRSRLAEWTSIRNNVVHGAASVGAAACRDVVEGVQRILRTLRTDNSDN